MVRIIAHPIPKYLIPTFPTSSLKVYKLRIPKIANMELITPHYLIVGQPSKTYLLDLSHNYNTVPGACNPTRLKLSCVRTSIPSAQTSFC